MNTVNNNESLLSRYSDYRSVQLDNVAKELGEANERTVTGKYTSDLSSHPKTFQKVSQLNGVIASKKQAKEDIEVNRSDLHCAGEALKEINDLVQQAQVIALQGASNNEPTVMFSLAKEVNDLKTRVANISNRQNFEGDYIFGGYKNDQKPFVEGTRLTDPADPSSLPINTLIFSGADYDNNQKAFMIEEDMIEADFPPNQFFKDLYESLDKLSLHLQNGSTAEITSEDVKDPVNGNMVSVPGDIEKLKGFLNTNQGNMGSLARVEKELNARHKIATNRITEVTDMISEATDISLDKAITEQTKKQNVYNMLNEVNSYIEYKSQENIDTIFRYAIRA